MKQLTGLDATFLHLETGAQFGHVSGLSIYARPDTPGYDPYAAWRAQLEQRLHLLEPLRRRLVEIPLGLDHPYWIEDPNFDLDFHVRHSAVPPPGRDDQLAEVVARMVAAPRPMQRGPRGPVGTVLNLGRNRGEDRDPPPTLPSAQPPRTPFNRPITPHRKLAIGSASLSAVKAIKTALGATVNDVVLAV